MTAIAHYPWNCQQPDGPNFRYDKARMETYEARFLESAGVLLGVVKHLDADASEKLKIELIANEALQTSAIEGEILDRESVQSSLRRHFGLQVDTPNVPPAEQGISEMMADLYQTFAEPLAHETLFRWHLMLTKGRSHLIEVGRYRTHQDSMRVVPGRLDRPTVHFEAPPSVEVPAEMNRFTKWFNRSASGGMEQLPSITRAGIAHLYFVTIHPFEGCTALERCTETYAIYFEYPLRNEGAMSLP